MKFFLLVSVLSFVIISINSCSDDPTSIGSNLVNSDFIHVGSFDSQVDSLAQSSSSFKKVIPLGFSSKIHIGKRGETVASTLLRFEFSVDDSMRDDFLEDSILINRAFIQLTPAATFTEEAAFFDFSVHKVNNEWLVSQFTSDDLPDLLYDAADLSSNKNFTDSLYTFDIDNELVLSWVKTSIDTNLGKNYGIYCKPDLNSGKIISFEALTGTSTGEALIKMIIEKQGSYIDTIRGYVIGDISTVTTELPTLPAGEISVQAGTSIQSKLFFDLTTLPENVIINKAELFIRQDTLNSIMVDGSTSSLLAFVITDEDSTTVDEASATTIFMNNNTYTANITHLIHYWYTGGDNFGMLLTPYNEIEGLNLIALKGSDYPVEIERPRLKIVYTTREN